jgi:formyl-CoA transferase
MTLLGVGDDPRFASFEGRVAHRAELDTIVQEWVGARTEPEVVAAFEAAHAAIAPVYSIAEVARDPHVVARGSLIDVDGVTMPGVIARFSRTPGNVRFAGRGLDADEAEILAELASVPVPEPEPDSQPESGRESSRGASA